MSDSEIVNPVVMIIAKKIFITLLQQFAYVYRVGCGVQYVQLYKHAICERKLRHTIPCMRGIFDGDFLTQWMYQIYVIVNAA